MNTYQLIVGDRVHAIQLSDQYLQSLLNNQGHTATKPQQPIDEPPTAKQVKFAKGIGATLKIPLPAGILTSKAVCWNFINDNKEAAAKAQKTW
ncbi:hypothetical protein L4C36_20695 [Photobacterium japonica]|uniref:hypothetical protein n=1 Tax=Photobacterium japonica TaxID=2910235 RepID=UPI003D12CCCF